MSSVIERIRTKGYWDISIRPGHFRSDLVPYDELDVILSNAVVRLRGWPVPFIDYRQPFLRDQGWIGQDIDARSVSHEEAWRFFTSGQFAQLRGISADWRIGAEATSVPVGEESVIEVWEILFYLTEIIELAARLAVSSAGGNQMRIDVRLHGLENRLLVSGDPHRILAERYRANMPSIQQKRTLQRDHLLAESRLIAVEISREMFLRFGFKASSEILSEYQGELTENR
jgi:hypothetical protein